MRPNSASTRPLRLSEVPETYLRTPNGRDLARRTFTGARRADDVLAAAAAMRRPPADYDARSTCPPEIAARDER